MSFNVYNLKERDKIYLKSDLLYQQTLMSTCWTRFSSQERVNKAIHPNAGRVWVEDWQYKVVVT